MEELGKELMSILVSSPSTLTIAALDKDYNNLVGNRIPFRKFGFSNLENLLRCMTNVLVVNGSGPYAEVLLKVSKKSSHINELVTKQKVNVKNRSRFGKRKRPFINPLKSSFYAPLQQPTSSWYSCFNSNPTFTVRSQPVSTNLPVLKVEKPVIVSCECTDDSNRNSSSGVIPKQTVDLPTPTVDDESEFIYSSDTDSESEPLYNIVEQSCQTSKELTYNSDELTTPSTSSASNSSHHEDNVPLSVKNNLKYLISQHDDGIWCAALPEVYEKMFKKELDFQEYGYGSLITLCINLPEIFQLFRPYSGDFKLYNKMKPLPDNCIQERKVAAKLSEYQNDSWISDDPALLDVQDIIKDNFKFPEDVVSISEIIPRQFLSEDMMEEDYIEVCIGEVYDPSKFWLLLNDYTQDLNQLMKELEQFYTSAGAAYAVPDHVIRLGLHCVTKFQGEFHRAIVVHSNNPSKSHVRVYYFDYGTVSTVPRNSINFLHKKFATLPQQAIRARLAGIFPPYEKTQWTCEASQCFLNLVFSKVVIAHIHRINFKDQIVEVFLIDTSGPEDTHLNDMLVKEGHAIFTSQVKNELGLINENGKDNLCNGDEQKSVPKSHATPCVKYIHFFPTFWELELGRVPNATEMSHIDAIGIPLERIYPQYYEEKNKEDNFLNNELDYSTCLKSNSNSEEHLSASYNSTSSSIHVENISSSTSYSSKQKCTIFKPIEQITPPPGFHNLLPSNLKNQNMNVPIEANFLFQPGLLPTPQMSFSNVTLSQLALLNQSYSLQQKMHPNNLYLGDNYLFLPGEGNIPQQNYQNISHQNDREVIENLICNCIIQNKSLQSYFTQFLLFQMDNNYSLIQTKMLNCLIAIESSALYVNYLIIDVIRSLNNVQLLNLLQIMNSASIQETKCVNKNSDNMINLVQDLRINESEGLDNISYTEENFEESAKRKVTNEKSRNLVIQTGKEKFVCNFFHSYLGGKKVCVIWFENEAHISSNDVMQLLPMKISFNQMKKQLVLMGDTIPTLTLCLKNNMDIYNAISRYTSIDQDNVLHLFQVTSVEQVLSCFNVNLNMNDFLNNIKADSPLWTQSTLYT
ncbi:hypothetical protein FQA39_LY00439 [Lamprigera yunnana]|nr:hypothetical protein FQA39_LY00439 [Lamprigera yunnana]